VFPYILTGVWDIVELPDWVLLKIGDIEREKKKSTIMGLLPIPKKRLLLGMDLQSCQFNATACLFMFSQFCHFPLNP